MHGYSLSSWALSMMPTISIIFRFQVVYPNLALSSDIQIYRSKGLFSISTLMVTPLFFLSPLVAIAWFVQHSFRDPIPLNGTIRFSVPKF